MKINQHLIMPPLRSYFFPFFLVVVFIVSSPRILIATCFSQQYEFKSEAKEIISSVHVADESYKKGFENVAIRFVDDRRHVVVALIEVLKDGKASNLNQCAAAYYLGEMRAGEAAKTLAHYICLDLNVDRIDMHALPIVEESAAMAALVKIGNASIPALVENLRTSDADNVRQRSLKALYEIDGEKDILKLRLKKSLLAETDSSKKARLNAALKSIETLELKK